MNLYQLSWKYIKSKPLNTFLNITLMALGISIIVVLLLLSQQVEEKLSKNAQGIDLVVGAKGSPLQLILSSVYHVDFPTGNIKLQEAEKLAKNRLVKNIIPLAMGDSYAGFRIVGTNHDYPSLYQLTLNEGRLWENVNEAVLGAEVAAVLELKVGDLFEGAHGISNESHTHEEQAYEVVGILSASQSVPDRLILTSVETVWAMHEEHETDEAIDPESHETHADHHHDKITLKGLPKGDSLQEVTSLIVQYRSPMAAIQLPRQINANTNMQAASPAFETARLFSLLGIGISLFQGFAYLIIFIAGLSIFIALINSLKERRYDLAIMRSLGASRSKLFLHIILEGLLITGIGALAGIALGHCLVFLLTWSNSQSAAAGISGFVFIFEELWIIGLSLVVGILAALIPAWSAYKTDISKVLSKE